MIVIYILLVHIKIFIKYYLKSVFHNNDLLQFCVASLPQKHDFIIDIQYINFPTNMYVYIYIFVVHNASAINHEYFIENLQKKYTGERVQRRKGDVEGTRCYRDCRIPSILCEDVSNVVALPWVFVSTLSTKG